MERVARTVSYRFARVFDCGFGSFLHRANCGRFHYLTPAAGEGGWDFDGSPYGNLTPGAQPTYK